MWNQTACWRLCATKGFLLKVGEIKVLKKSSNSQRYGDGFVATRTHTRLSARLVFIRSFLYLLFTVVTFFFMFCFSSY